ncbi:hypothetical protein Dda_3553 [Drechslerella dactyloides]|uniref:F-box domain-containing protein n=1 Tax=Drechslerella dactyloides TaxID=74499 RepID=A0AAD6J2M8_DREDA|nr:hypothetical protein Dda_3553 [Drechslerella dactyloides]
MPVLRGISCYVDVEDNRAGEYGLECKLDPAVATCSIESQEDKRFCFQLSFTHADDHAGRYAYEVYADGLLVAGYSSTSKIVTLATVQKFVNGQWEMRGLRFSKLETVDRKAPDLESRNKVLKSVDKIHEKSLKGRGVSHKTSFGEATYSSERLYYSVATKLDPQKIPYATFVFRYASKAHLQSEGLIPRTPSPEPVVKEDGDVDDMAPEALRQEIRRLRNQSRQSKAVKRELESSPQPWTPADPDELSIQSSNGPAAKRAGYSHTQCVMQAASNITSAEFKGVLSRYPATLKLVSESKQPKKPKAGDLKTLEEIDKWRDTVAERARSQRGGKAESEAPILDASMVKEIVLWKLKRGKFRPTILPLVSSNPVGSLQATVEEALSMSPPDQVTLQGGQAEEEDDDDDEDDALAQVSAMMKVLTKLKGIGPATATAILSSVFPDTIPMFSDEAFRWIMMEDPNPSGGWNRKIAYDAKEYAVFFKRVRRLCRRLSSENEDLVDADSVEKVGWVLGQEAALGIGDRKVENASERKTASPADREHELSKTQVVETTANLSKIGAKRKDVSAEEGIEDFDKTLTMVSSRGNSYGKITELPTKRSFTNIRLRSPKTPPAEPMQYPMTPPDEIQSWAPGTITDPGSAISPTTKVDELLFRSPSPRAPIVTRKPVPTVIVPQTKPFAFLDTPEQTPTVAVRRDASPARNIEDFGVPSSKPLQKRSLSLMPEKIPRSPIVLRTRGQSVDQTNTGISIAIPKRKPVPARIENKSAMINTRTSGDGLEETIEQTLAWLERERADDLPGPSDYTPLPLHHERILPGISGFPSFSSGSTLSSSPSFKSNSTSTSLESRSKTPPPTISSTPFHIPRIPARKPSLPSEIILKILSHLPSLDSIMSARLICPRFNDVIAVNNMVLIRAHNPSAYSLINILFPGENNFESFREMLDALNRDEVTSMRLALWNIWCFSLNFGVGFADSEECHLEQRIWLSRFGRKELFAMIEMCGLISVLLRPLLEIAYSVELTDKFRRDAYFDDQPLDIKERYELIENLLAFLRTVGLDHIYELSSIFGSSETAASPKITRNIACDYIIENMLIETWERDLGKAYSNFMMKPMKDLHLELEKEARKSDFDGKKAREEMGWGPSTPGNDDEELVAV